MGSITVIIATYNRADLLRGALLALTAQHDPGVPVTVVVADNGSTDHTRDVFTEVADQAGRFEWIYLLEPGPGKSLAVNAALARTSPGSRAARRGRWFVFTDDDVRPSPGWLLAIARAFAASAPDFVVGRILPTWEAPPPDWLSPQLFGVLGIPDNGESPLLVARGVNEHVMAIGANMAVSAAAIERTGGFRPDLGKMRGTLRTGEDHEFYLRLILGGCHGVYAPDALVHHLVPAERLSRAYFREWLHENGRNVATLEAAYPPRLPKLLGVPRYKWRKAAADAAVLLGAGWRLSAAERFRRSMALVWFAGYVGERWTSILGLGSEGGPPPAPGRAITAGGELWNARDRARTGNPASVPGSENA